MRIAIVGSAPSSIGLTPLGDAGWAIWGCSPAAAQALIPSPQFRMDAWFEMHLFEPGAECFHADYVAFMAGLTCPVYMLDQVAAVPASIAFPKDAMIDKFGPYFWTSTVSYMLALAIEQMDSVNVKIAAQRKALDETDPKTYMPPFESHEIGLFGIDMSATEEYGYQRAGCHHFLELCRSRGIKVSVPATSDLLRPPPMYGYAAATPMGIKLATRAKELADAAARHKVNHEAVVRDAFFIEGSRSELNYWRNTWLPNE